MLRLPRADLRTYLPLTIGGPFAFFPVSDTGEFSPVVGDALAPPAPIGWQPWLAEMFPSAVSYPMAPHHEKFWGHVETIDLESAPRPFGAVWAREGGKSTNVELGVTYLGVRDCRRYVVYVRQTQERADDSVGNIATRLESEKIARYYPAHSQKLLSKFGHSRGWKVNRLRTAGGLTVDAFGLDKASRGAKLDDQRPDLIVFDDVDDGEDSPAETARKRRLITRALLPAGSENCAVIWVQNLIIADGLMTQLVDGRAEFLGDRVMSGPFPALEGFKWEWRDDDESGTRRAFITAGTPTWAGQSVAKCQVYITRFGPEAFRREMQHEVKERAEGLAIDFDEAEHFEDLTRTDVQRLVSTGNNLGGMDFGHWRFAFVCAVVDEWGVVHLWGEVFSQREELSVRAQRIIDLLIWGGVLAPGGERFLRPFKLWGDAANPTDIAEINKAFREKGCPVRVVAVGADGKLRKTAVTRLNEKLSERAIRVTRWFGRTSRWLLNYNAGNAGTPMKQSRLLWEFGKWSYPVPADGKVDLKQDPDDHSADGADMIAALRYMVMSWWKPAQQETPDIEDVNAPAVLAAEVKSVYTLRGRRKRARGHTRRSDDGDE